MKKEFGLWDYFKTKKRAGIALDNISRIEGMEDMLKGQWIYHNTGIDGSLADSAASGEMIEGIPEGYELGSIQHYTAGSPYFHWVRWEDDFSPAQSYRGARFYSNPWYNTGNDPQEKRRNDIPNDMDMYYFSILNGYHKYHEYGEPIPADGEHVYEMICALPLSEELEIQCDDGEFVYWNHGSAYAEIFLRIPLCNLTREELRALCEMKIISAKEHNIAILKRHALNGLKETRHEGEWNGYFCNSRLYKFCAHYHEGQSDPIYALIQDFAAMAWGKGINSPSMRLSLYDDEEVSFLAHMGFMEQGENLRGELI